MHAKEILANRDFVADRHELTNLRAHLEAVDAEFEARKSAGAANNEEAVAAFSPLLDGIEPDHRKRVALAREAVEGNRGFLLRMGLREFTDRLRGDA